MSQDRAEGHRCVYEDMVLGTDVVGDKRARTRIKSTSEPKEKPVKPGRGDLGAEPRLWQGLLGRAGGRAVAGRSAGEGALRREGGRRRPGKLQTPAPANERRAGLRGSTRLQRGWRTRWRWLLLRRRRPKSGSNEGTAGLEFSRIHVI